VGVLTLSGNASVAQYEAALRSVSYRNDSDAPSTTTRTLTFTVDDGSALNPVNSANRDLQLTAVNDAPLLGLNATPLAYLENNAGLSVDAALTLADNDSTTLSGATVTIGSGFDASQDQLVFVTVGSITASYNSSTGVLTASGTATMAEYQAFLRSVSYVNLSDAPGTSTRTVSVSVDDGSGINATATANRDIQVIAINDAPLVTANASALSYTEGDGAVVIDPSITVSDADSATLVGATVQLSDNHIPGQDLLGFVTQSGITGSFDSGSGTLSLSGNATVAQYQAALRSVTYTNVSDDPSTNTRTVTFTVSDGSAAHPLGSTSRQIDVAAVNDASVLSLTPAPLVYTEGDGGVTFDASLALSDSDNLILVGATVSIGTGWSSAEDRLSFLSQNGISGSYDINTGVLTLIGTASVAQYETALRSVSYLNLSEMPSTATRTVTVMVDDGSASRDIQVVSVNDAPVVALDNAPLGYLEGQGSALVAGIVTLSDADSLTLVSANVQISQGFAGPEDVLGFVNQNGITGSYNASTGVLTFTGTATVADYQACLRLVTYTNTSQTPSAATRTLSISVDDGGSVFAAGSASRDLSLTQVNDAPSLIASSTPLNYLENQVATAIDAALQVQDSDSPDLVGATVRISNFVAGQDELVFIAQNGIAGAFDTQNGILTLTGVATVSDYQAALRSAGYVNTSDNPNTAQRQILFTVDDGSALQALAQATSTVDVFAANDAPQIDAPPVLQLTQGQSVSLADRWVVLDPDSDHQAMTYTLFTGPWQGQLFMGNALLTTGSTFTQADVNAGLIVYRHNGLGTGADILQLTAVDAQGVSLTAGVMTLNLQVSPPLPPSSGSVMPGDFYAPPTTVDGSTNPNPDTDNASSDPPDQAPEKTQTTSQKPPTSTRPAQNDAVSGDTDNTRLSVPAVNSRSDMAYAAPNAASYQLLINGTQGLVRTNFDLALQIVESTVGNMASTGLSVVPNLSQGGDTALSQTLTWDLPASDHQLPLIGNVSAHAIEASGIALTVGAVWWISRSATLLGSLLLSTPIWRSIDPLPVFAAGTQHDDEPDTQTHDDAVAEQMFNDAAPPHANDQVIG
jgi:Cadherin-like